MKKDNETSMTEFSSTQMDIDQLTYEQAFAELEKVVSSLENNQSPLEDALVLFERGQALVRRCNQLLDQAELRVRQLSDTELQEGEDPFEAS